MRIVAKINEERQRLAKPLIEPGDIAPEWAKFIELLPFLRPAKLKMRGDECAIGVAHAPRVEVNPCDEDRPKAEEARRTRRPRKVEALFALASGVEVDLNQSSVKE